jgi:5-methylcytosine-specific restriction protein A
MTLHRRPEIRFGEAARGTCRWCGEAILHGEGEKAGLENRRRRWHPECVETYNASDPREARRRVRRRDRGVCAECRIDTYKLRRELKKKGRGMTRELRKLGFKPRKSLWELDHIVPLIDGGGHADENLQTLCTPCHTKKTAAEARARAERGRVEAEHPEPQAPRVPDDTSVEVSSRDERARRRKRGGSSAQLDDLLATADATNARVRALLDEIRPR